MARKKAPKTESPDLDLSSPAFLKLLGLAKSRGFVTYEEFNAVLPTQEITSVSVEAAMALFSEVGANVLEGLPPETFPKGWVSKIGVDQLVNKHTHKATLADIMTVHKFGYIASVIKRWNEVVRPNFNWGAVFSFHPAATVYSINALNRAQALMQIKQGHVVRCGTANRKPVVYVSFLEVAPWNSRKAKDRKFSGLGEMLIRVAQAQSVLSGTEGRVGLHSLLDAEEFYKKLGFKPMDCSNEYNEVYYELDSKAASNNLQTDD
jgi:Sigma-70 factor, region 1.1